MRYVQIRNEFHNHTFCPSARRGYETGQVAVDDYYNVCGDVSRHHQQPRLQNSPYFRLCEERARDTSKERPGVRVKTASETRERREREIRVSSLATQV